MSAQTLLVELFTEELPPKSLKKLGTAFAKTIHAGLISRGLATTDAEIKMFATPRRLAVAVPDVLALAPDRSESKKLMPAKVAFDAAGNPTPALQKRLEKEGATIAQTSSKDESGEPVVFLTQTIKGATLAEGLQVTLIEAITSLPIPKVMTYQLVDGLTSVQFVRPAHGLVALHGAQIVPVNALGLAAGNVVHGHRFQGAKDIVLAHADEYEMRLEKEGGVMASFEKRQHEIERLLRIHAEQLGDTLGNRDDYLALLDEVTGLVEMATVYVGQFEHEFLEVPSECLILTMKLNQKYFPLFRSGDETMVGLSARFLIVSNMRLDNPRNVIEGNQRVVRPRLSDARFFFETDKKIKLIDRLPKLTSVVYHNKLGSQGERVTRVQRLAGGIADLIGASRVDAERAALLAKADLVTDMVGEFPELQGVMGRYYALHDGEGATIADAIQQHYQPRFAGDVLPTGKVGIAVAIADKMETLAGLFSIGQEPTGDKDPFAMRRHALGVLRMLIECNLSLSVRGLVESAFANFPAAEKGADEKLVTYLFDRLVGYLRELGYTALEVDAVVTVRPPRWGEFPARLAAVRAFTLLPEAHALAAANKRIGNILKKSNDVTMVYDKAKLIESAEAALAGAIEKVFPVAAREYDDGQYEASLKSLAALRKPVDDFFDQVMVNADDPVIRANRLGLLATMHREMNRVADLSKLAA